MKRIPGIAIALATACISGAAVFVNGFAVKQFDDAAVYTTAKNGVAAAFLAVLALALRRPAPRTKLPRAQRAGLVAVGVIGGGIPFVLFFEGLARASSVQAAFIHKTLIVWVALLAIPLLRERAGRWHLTAIALLVAGQAALTKDVGNVRFGKGEIMIFAATLLWAVETVVAKRLLGAVAPATLGVARMGIGLATLIGFLAVTGRAGDLASLGANEWRWALITGAILTGYVATWYAALARAQAIDVTAVLVFGAVVTAMLAGSFNAVPLAPNALGLSLVAAGTFVVTAAATRRGAMQT